MIDDHHNQIRGGAEPLPQSTGSVGGHSPQLGPDVALWTPSLVALLLSGIVSGSVLGAADGVVFH